MPQFDSGIHQHTRPERWISAVVVVLAVVLGIWVAWLTDHHPRTDDAEIFANYIGMAPLVQGPLVQLNVHDNEYVKKGTLLYVIDPRPYEYAYQKALSDQASLEGEIQDEQRRINAEVSGVSVSAAGIQMATANVAHAAAGVNQAKADVANSQQGVRRAHAEWTYANDNLHRLEPLLVKQFVTADQVDRARQTEIADEQALQQAKSQLRLSQAGLVSAEAQYRQAKAALTESHATHQQSMHAVLTLAPLIEQRGAKAAAVRLAKYNLDSCYVYAPFDARVTNLVVSDGTYVHVGQRVFTLIDTRVWWALANFREGQLDHIQPGMKADVYIMAYPNRRFQGVVASEGFGVTPDVDVIGRLAPGLPDVQRTLNWVHLAARYPVRVRIVNPPPDIFRIGQTAVVTVRGG